MTARLARNAAQLFALLIAASLASCGGDGPTGPAAAAGTYRLRTVNGGPLPYMSQTLFGFVSITSGDMVLRRDETFTLGMTDGVGSVALGTYDVSGSALTLRLVGAGSGQPVILSGLVAGDSAVVEVTPSPTFGGPTMRYAYERYSPAPGPITNGRYALVAVTGVAQSGGPGFVTYDSTAGGSHTVERILYDTLTFSDGVLFHRHQAEELTWNDALSSSSERAEWGSYTGTSGMIVLHPYATPSASPDSFQATPATLTKAYTRSGLALHYAMVP